jgi:hypothetical protein
VRQGPGWVREARKGGSCDERKTPDAKFAGDRGRALEKARRAGLTVAATRDELGVSRQRMLQPVEDDR